MKALLLAVPGFNNSCFNHLAGDSLTKRVLNLAILVLLMQAGISSAMGQDYKWFRVGIGAGLALPSGNLETPGLIASIEPGFRITNNLLLGLKGEAGTYTRSMSRKVSVVDPSTQFVSGTAFAQFYFSPNYFRPFIAGGAGFTQLSDEQVDVTFNGSSETLMIGKDHVHFFARAGIEVWHVAASAEVIFAGDEKPTDFLEIQSSYFSFRLMFFIGGGLR